MDFSWFIQTEMTFLCEIIRPVPRPRPMTDPRVGQLRQPSISNDGQTIAFKDSIGDAYLLNLGTGSVILVSVGVGFSTQNRQYSMLR